MYEAVGGAVEYGPEDEAEHDLPEVDVDALLAADPSALPYYEDRPIDPDPAWLAELAAQPPERPETSYSEADRPLHDRDPQTYTDAETVGRLIGVEAGIAQAHALRAELVALLAQNRPAITDRPDGEPGAARPAPAEDVVPEVLPVSEWLSHELQMAHPYSRPPR